MAHEVVGTSEANSRSELERIRKLAYSTPNAEEPVVGFTLTGKQFHKDDLEHKESLELGAKLTDVIAAECLNAKERFLLRTMWTDFLSKDSLPLYYALLEKAKKDPNVLLEIQLDPISTGARKFDDLWAMATEGVENPSGEIDEGKRKANFNKMLFYQELGFGEGERESLRRYYALREAGVTVTVDKEKAKFLKDARWNQHSKYMIVDDKVMLTSVNFDGPVLGGFDYGLYFDRCTYPNLFKVVEGLSRGERVSEDFEVDVSRPNQSTTTFLYHAGLGSYSRFIEKVLLKPNLKGSLDFMWFGQFTPFLNISKLLARHFGHLSLADKKRRIYGGSKDNYEFGLSKPLAILHMEATRIRGEGFEPNELPFFFHPKIVFLLSRDKDGNEVESVIFGTSNLTPIEKIGVGTEDTSLYTSDPLIVGQLKKIFGVKYESGRITLLN